MATFVLVWSVAVALLFAADFVVEIGRLLRIGAKRIPRATLEEKVAAADEYEIAFVRGGEHLARAMALRHLARGGYYEKVDGTLVPAAGKDLSPLSDFEKAMLLPQVSAEYGAFLYSGDEGSVSRLIEGYERKARELSLFYKRPSLAGRTTLLLVLIIAYILAGGTQDQRTQLIVGGLIVAAGALLLWRRRIHRPESVVVDRKERGRGMRQALSNHVLTRNGREYVALFERTHYPLDEKLAEALWTCPCSLLD
jgi:hypothetical protein